MRTGQTAETYRSFVGGDKDQFESVAPLEQQQMNPQAAQSFQDYHTLDQVIDTLQEMNANLMDYSQRIEHEMLNQFGKKANKAESPETDHLGNLSP